MELLAQVGYDLPGAVRVLPEDAAPEEAWDPPAADTGPYGKDADTEHAGWRFSLAGVGLKFSMVGKDDRLTLPAHGAGGDWIVKLPDRVYADVPRNEYAMMSLAAAVGIDVPEIKLVHRDKLDDLPPGVWPPGEDWAYAIRRFDRDDDRKLVHIEDLVQVRNVYATSGRNAPRRNSTITRSCGCSASAGSPRIRYWNWWPSWTRRYCDARSAGSR